VTLPARVRLGRVVRPHGLRGEVVVRSSGFAAGELAAVGEVDLVRESGAAVRRARVRGARAHGAELLVAFEGIADLEAAGELRGLWLEAERAALPDAGTGRVYHFDLLGLEVVDEGGRVLGRVNGVLPTGAHEVLQVATATGELLVPYHAGTVLGWDPAARRLTVRLPEGLEEVYRPPEPERP